MDTTYKIIYNSCPIFIHGCRLVVFFTYPMIYIRSVLVRSGSYISVSSSIMHTEMYACMYICTNRVDIAREIFRRRGKSRRSSVPITPDPFPERQIYIRSERQNHRKSDDIRISFNIPVAGLMYWRRKTAVSPRCPECGPAKTLTL